MDCEGEQVQGDQNGREVLFSGIMAAAGRRNGRPCDHIIDFRSFCGSRTDARRATEVGIAARPLNCMLKLGRLEFVRIA